MKTFRILGAVFCVLGCVLALLGIVTSVLPMIENEQFQLIVNSFQVTSADPLTNTLNAIVIFCLRSGYFLFFCGVSLTVAGGLISSSAHKRQKAADPDIPEITPLPAPQKPSGAPQPAYYPGGLAPSAVNFSSEADDDTAAPVVSTMKMPSVQLIDDTEEPEPALPSIENDSHKLMRNDAVLSAQAQFKRPAAAPDYSRYPSNTQPHKPAAAEEFRQAEPLPKRPKIVSTMGKKPL